MIKGDTLPIAKRDKVIHDKPLKGTDSAKCDIKGDRVVTDKLSVTSDCVTVTPENVKQVAKSIISSKVVNPLQRPLTKKEIADGYFWKGNKLVKSELRNREGTIYSIQHNI